MWKLFLIVPSTLSQSKFVLEYSISSFSTDWLLKVFNALLEHCFAVSGLLQSSYGHDRSGGYAEECAWFYNSIFVVNFNAQDSHLNRGSRFYWKVQSSVIFLHLMKEMCTALTQTLALYVGHTFGHYKCHNFWKFWRIVILGVLTVVNTLAVYIDASFHWSDGNLFCMLASASVEHNACRLKCGSFGCLLQMTFTLTTLLWCVMLLTLLESW